jgi:3-oxoacyl-[acyl-carrier protein] reductase
VNFLHDDPRGPEAVEKLVAEGGKAIMAPGSVGDAAEAEAMVGKAVAELGRLDLLVNNAGTPGTRRKINPPELEAITEELWQTLLSVNLLGVFRCAKAAAPALRAAKGAIVNTASVAGLGRRGSSLAYGASKAGLINITKGLARALAPDVRVNAVAPGLIQTPWTNPWPDERKQATLERTLLARLGKPQDIAETMLFLAAGAAYITGETIVVDGGAA